MFRRKNKQPEASEPGRGQRNRSASSQQSISPAFSYYTNRSSNPEGRRVRSNGDNADPASPETHRSVLPLIPIALLGLVVVVCLGKLLLLSTDPKVIVLGKTTVSGSYLQSATVYQAAAQKLLSSSLMNRTKITANLDGTASSLERQFPELQAASVTLPLIGNRPIIYVQVAQPSVILQNAHGNFALNKSGLVLAKVSQLPFGIPVVVDQSGATPRPGHQYLPGSTLSFIGTVSYQFAAAKLGVSAFVLPTGSPYELDVRLEGKPYVVRFNLTGDPLAQSGGAIATVVQLGATTPANYIDVRVPGRVYYK
jgi:hypothetical protein